MRAGRRLGVLSVAFALLFGVLTLRLWSIQVAASHQYQEAAQDNLIKSVSTPAPRGQIRDITGRLIADSRNARIAVIEGALIPRDGKDALVRNLSAFSGLPSEEIEALVEEAQTRGDRIQIGAELTDRQVVFLAEHQEDFIGLRVVNTPVRTYVEGELTTDVIGYIGRPNLEDLERPGVSPTDVLGKAGVERQYNNLIRGEPGRITYRINARGEILEELAESLPIPGSTVYLTIDNEVQKVLETSLKQGLELSRQLYRDGGCTPNEDDKGCPVRAVGVVIDATDGSVVAMSSVPGYDPNIFVKGVSAAEWEQLTSQAAFNNFAIQGEYAPASTFKAIAYVAALEEGIFPQEIRSEDEPYTCDGHLEFRFNDGSPQIYRDWLANGHGDINLHKAMHQSCDLYFWELALQVWKGRDDAFDSDVLQQWARKVGLDAPTGIDLPFEKGGLIPDEEWFTTAQEERPHLVRDTPWAGGDVMNIVVGQGSVQTTPLQIANAYATLVNGGSTWQPRVVDRVVGPEGDVLTKGAHMTSEVPLTKETVDALRMDLQQVVNGPAGTARTAFRDFGENVEQVGGKTGTAEVIKFNETNANVVDDDVDTALFVGVAPILDPKYVVTVVIERGGSGGRVAAPTAARVLQYLLNGQDGVTEIIPGQNSD